MSSVCLRPDEWRILDILFVDKTELPMPLQLQSPGLGNFPLAIFGARFVTVGVRCAKLRERCQMSALEIF